MWDPPPSNIAKVFAGKSTLNKHLLANSWFSHIYVCYCDHNTTG